MIHDTRARRQPPQRQPLTTYKPERSTLVDMTLSWLDRHDDDRMRERVRRYLIDCIMVTDITHDLAHYNWYVAGLVTLSQAQRSPSH